MIYVALAIALVSTGVSVVLALKVFQLYAMLSDRQPIESSRAVAISASQDAEPPSKPLEGLKIALAITQDHPHAVFVDLLKDQLFAEDVTDIVVLDASDAVGGDAPDLVIKGTVVCNGYAEIYYSADFTCSNRQQAICTLIEKPPHGDRPQNLAIELISRLKKELEKLIDRSERRNAIRELNG